MGKDVIIHCIYYKILKDRGQLLVKKKRQGLLLAWFIPTVRLVGQ